VDRRPKQDVELNESTISPCSLNEEILIRVKGESNILPAVKEGKVTLSVTSCVGTAFCNTLLKERGRRKD